MDCKTITEKSRDRVEKRTAYTAKEIGWLFGKEKWKSLCCIGAIKAKFERKGTKTEEWHYYISSRNLTALELLHHARMEWTVETMLLNLTPGLRSANPGSAALSTRLWFKWTSDNLVRSP